MNIMISIKSLLFFNVLTALFTTVFPMSLPSYMTACKKNDPNLQQCTTEQAGKAFSKVVNGDKKYGVSNVNPIKLPFFDVDVGPNLKMSYADLIVAGLSKAKISLFTIDPDKKEINLEVTYPKLDLSAKYNMIGQILLFPIKGNGVSNSTFEGGVCHYKADYKLVNKDGKDYIEVTKTAFTMKLEHASFHYDNLFNGDKQLGDQVNLLLNENWEDVMKEIGNGVNKAFKEVVTSVLKGYFSRVPYNEILID